MKDKIIELIIELICVVGIYILLMIMANKLGIIETTPDIISTSIGFAIGWFSVKLVTIKRQSKKEKSK